MKKIKFIATLLAVILSFGLFSCSDTRNPLPLTAEEIYDKAKDCVVEIVTYNKKNQELALGSGFVLSSDGKIVTNYHVIEESYSAKVFVGETEYPVNTILAYNIDKDIAVLKIDASKLKTLTINYSEPTTGSTIYALGSSRGLTSTFSKGIVTTSSRELDGVTYIQHDAAISNGNSGGPLINEKCEIIGINTLTIRDSQNLNLAIPASEINSLDYSTNLTLPQLYDKECDAFNKLKNHIVANGEYDYEDKNYYFFAGGDIYDDTYFSRAAFYYPETNKITISLLTDLDFYFNIELIKDASIYDYTLLNTSNSLYIYGSIYPNSFSTYSSSLSYSGTNIYYTSTITSYRQLAASCAQLLLLCLDEDYVSIGITAYDLGFVNF